MAHLDPNAVGIHTEYSSKTVEIIRNLLVALTVSFVALSLGAAFGVLSGRGAFVGMFSAGLIAIIAAALGGTRVQCSGPVAPMAAIMATFFAVANAEYLADPMALGGVTPDHFLNLVCFICGGVMLLMAALRTGFLISYVPDSVISGFMSGIALIIWIGQTEYLFGLDGIVPIGGDLTLNIVVVVLTLVMTFATQPILRRINPTLSRLVPGTLVALIVAAIVADVLKFDIQHVSIESAISSWQDFTDFVHKNIPYDITWLSVKKALPMGIEFALISYLDSLMVALIIDRLRGEKTRLNKELMAQGVANTAVGFIGGVPGTQASIRSVMVTKEGGSMRMAGIMVGVFVIVEMLMLQDLLALIPQAVFIGILAKVGWDVFDKKPVWAFITRKADAPSALDFFTIIGTAIVTVYNLTLAVCLFTALHYLISYLQHRLTKAHAPTAYIEDVIEEFDREQNK